VTAEAEVTTRSMSAEGKVTTAPSEERGAFGADGHDHDDCNAPHGRGWRRILTSSVLYSRSPRGVRLLAAFVWLLFIVFPLLNAIGKHGSTLGHGALIGGAALFVVTYVTLVMNWRRHQDPRVPLVLFSLLVGLSIALTLSQASGWGFLFTYCAACVAIVAPEGAAFYGVALCSVFAGVTSAVAGANGGAVLGFVASSAGIGLLVAVMSDLRVRNEELSEARAELARMAVAQERARFARDLHDLLGHSLSVIALKAELAGRILGGPSGDGVSEQSPVGGRVERAVTEQSALEGRVERAVTEIRELEQVARTALGEVREAVSGYRQPTLAGELAGARMALAAAGIEADIHETPVPLDPAVEAVLAWAVREGATNVIRHSGARHCTLRVTASLSDAGVEVLDDGATGSRPGRDDGVGAVAFGSGLAGLAERARLLHGTMEAGASADSGYRLALTVPVSRS
jgi:two-component system, NarL family, sensor histidine kinase DesK